MLQRIDSLESLIEFDKENEEFNRLAEIGCNFSDGCQCESCYTFSMMNLVTDAQIQDMDESAEAELYRMLCDRAGSIEGLEDTIGRFE